MMTRSDTAFLPAMVALGGSWRDRLTAHGTVLKNEARFVKEWIEFHHDLGFDKIRIYDDNQFHGITSRRY